MLQLSFKRYNINTVNDGDDDDDDDDDDDIPFVLKIKIWQTYATLQLEKVRILLYEEFFVYCNI